MNEIYEGSIEPVVLQIWHSQQSVPSETPVLISFYDKHGTELDVGAGIATGPDVDNKYRYTLPAAITAKTGEFKIVWSYQVEGVELTKTEQVKVVRPYVLPEAFLQTYPGFEGISYASLQEIERGVRYTINSFCGQTFDVDRRSWRTMHLRSGNRLFMQERLLRIYGAYAGAYDVVNYINIDSTGFVLNYPSFDGFVSVKADIGIPGSPRIFRGGDELKVLGDWGWDYVPNEVQHAAMQLMADYLEPESQWHRNRVESVNAQDHKLVFAGNPYASTGNNQVDQILEPFKLFQPGAV